MGQNFKGQYQHNAINASIGVQYCSIYRNTIGVLKDLGVYLVDRMVFIQILLDWDSCNSNNERGKTTPFRYPNLSVLAKEVGSDRHYIKKAIEALKRDHNLIDYQKKGNAYLISVNNKRLDELAKNHGKPFVKSGA